MSAASPLHKASPLAADQGNGMMWRKYEEAQTKLGRALQENAELRQKHGESLRRIDSYLADFKATMAAKDDEIAQLKSQVASGELGGNQPEKDGFREEVEAILDGLEGNVPGETLLERLSNLAQQYESSAALEQSLMDLRAEFQRLKSTHSVPSPEVTHLREENSQLKEENSRLKMRLTKLNDEMQKLQKEVQNKETGKLEASNEIVQLEAEHGRSEQGMEQATDKDARDEHEKLHKHLLLEVQSLRKEREAKAGVVVKLEGKIKVLEGSLAKSKEDLQIATKLRSSLEAARSKSPDLHSKRKHTSNLEAKLKQLETQLVVAKESAEGERAAKEWLEQERKRLISEKTKLESRMVTLELQAKEKESEIVLLSGRLESQEAELRSKQQKLKDLGDGSKMKHWVAELQSQVSKLEQENYQLKRRSAKLLEERASTSPVKLQGTKGDSLVPGEEEGAGDVKLQFAGNEANMQQAVKEREALEVLLAQKQQTLSDVESKLKIAEADVSNLRSKLDALENGSLQNLSEPLHGVEEERHSLQVEKEKLEEQLAEMVQTVAKVTAAGQRAEDELKMKVLHLRRTESQLAKRLREVAAKDEDLRQTRVDFELEKKRVISLQAEMLSLKEWNESREATRVHGEVDLGTLQKLTERNEALQQQVHEEQLARLTLQRTKEELTRSLEQERHTKIQLQEEVTAKDAQLHELEMEVKTQQERTKSLAEQMRLSREESDDLRQQADQCEDHLRTAQLQLQLREEQLGADLKRATLQKRRSLEKLHSSREKHSRQRLSLESSLSSLKGEMQQSQLRLQQEELWRDSLEKSCKRLQQEKTQLQAKLTVIEGDAKDWKWKMAEKESQIFHLRKENQLLEERNRMLLSFTERMEVVSRNKEHQQTLSNSLDSRLASRLWTGEMT